MLERPAVSATLRLKAGTMPLTASQIHILSTIRIHMLRGFLMRRSPEAFPGTVPLAGCCRASDRSYLEASIRYKIKPILRPANFHFSIDPLLVCSLRGFPKHLQLRQIDDMNVALKF